MGPIFTKAIYKAEEYQKLKRLFNLMVTKFNVPVILTPTPQSVPEESGTATMH